MARLVGSKGDEAYPRAGLLRVNRGSVALTANRVHGIATLSGSFERLGDGGVQQHLKGPAKAPAGEVAVIDPEGLLEFLVQFG
jgi:purine-binding chemotaxis protein CheW